MKPLLSIIVPIYNVEPYLRACLDSILRQKFTDYELILVNDGSPDNCGKICDEYASRDNRIIVIHKENGGLSSARNEGLNIARGGYITFVDSDDELEETYKINMDILITDPKIDMLQFPFYNEKTKKTYNRFDKETKIIGFSNIITAWSKNIITSSIICNKIFKKKSWGNIKFPHGRVFEDQYINVDIISNINCAYYSQEGKYIYKFRAGSITNSIFTREREYDLLAAKIHTLRLLNRDDISDKIKSDIFVDAFRASIRYQLSNCNIKLISEFKRLKNALSRFSLFRNFKLSLFDSKVFMCKFFVCYILLHFCNVKLFIKILLFTK